MPRCHAWNTSDASLQMLTDVYHLHLTCLMRSWQTSSVEAPLTVKGSQKLLALCCLSGGEAAWQEGFVSSK